MKKVGAVLAVVGRALDGLDLGFCAYDAELRLMSFNSVFLALFPEHRSHIHAGEAYEDNLRRFFRARSPSADAGSVERSVAGAVERHRNQERPFEFTHHGRRLRVASLGVPGLLRVRIWKAVEPSRTPPARPSDAGGGALAEPHAAGLSQLARVADGVSVVDAAGAVVWANPTFVAMYGLAGGAPVVGRPFRTLVSAAWEGAAEGDARQALEILDAQAHCVGASFELPLPQQRWIRVVEQACVHDDGLRYFLHLEVSELRRQVAEIAHAQARASEQERLYHELARYSPDVIVSVRQRRLVYVSPAASTMLGWHGDELLGSPLARWLHPDDRALLRRVAQETAARGQGECRVRAARRDGSWLWVEARARSCADRPGAPPSGAVINVRDITARKQVEEEMALASAQLQQLADADSLTGLPNRRKFDRVLERECRRARRAGTTVAVLLLDIDHFKSVNDRHGHVVGDRVLCRVAAVIGRAARRAGELAARYGGEEFGVVLCGVGVDEAVERAERLREAVEGLAALPDAPAVTVSCGVAMMWGDAAPPSPLALVERADRALYRAKHAGRNRVQALIDPDATA